MAQTFNPNSPRQLTARLLECMGRFQKAAAPAKSGFDPLVYRDQLGQALVEMKDASAKVFAAGYTGGLDLIGEISTTIDEQGASRKPREAHEIFWDQVSQNYPVKGSWDIDFSKLSTNIQLRLLEQMIIQEREPHSVIVNQLLRMTDEAFMEGFTLSLKLTAPSEIQYRHEFSQLLAPLRLRLRNPELIPTAVEHIAAHQNLYTDYLRRVINVAALRDQLGRGANETVEHMVERRRRTVLKAMGFDEKDAQDMIESGEALEVVPDFNGFQMMQQALAFPPEFLEMLHEAIGTPLTFEIAEFCLDFPTGRMPYAVLERMGVTRPPEWHTNAQLMAELHKAIFLYEHAIHTPGIEISALTLSMHRFTANEASAIDRIVGILSNTPIKDSECKRKAQDLFDALVKNMEAGKSVSKLRDAIESGSIPGVFYRNHPALKATKLQNDLGM